MIKKQHGGKRIHPPGREGGRPKMKYGKKVLVLDCSDEEYQTIIKAIKDTRRRAAILLEAARTEGKTYDAI